MHSRLTVVSMHKWFVYPCGAVKVRPQMQPWDHAGGKCIAWSAEQGEWESGGGVFHCGNLTESFVVVAWLGGWLPMPGYCEFDAMICIIATASWLLTTMWHSHWVWACNSANIPNATTTPRSPISEAHIIGLLSMMVCKGYTTPKLTWSLVINITNNEKAPGTLLLEDCGCLPGPPHPPDPPPSSHLSPPHPGWGKTRLSGENFPRTPIASPVHLPWSTPMMDSWMVTVKTHSNHKGSHRLTRRNTGKGKRSLYWL